MATGRTAALKFLDGPEPIRLRDYQTAAVEDLRKSILAGNRRVLLQAGTGSGKTVVASGIIRSAVEKGSNVLFLAHRRELVDQCADKLWRFGVQAGIIMAGRRLDLAERVQVASIQTLWSRAVQREVIRLPRIDLIVVDECHRSTAKSYSRIIEAYPEAVVLGLTATPVRSDGRGLGEIYTDMVQAPGIAKLTSQGHLVPVRYYAPSTPDLEGVRVRGGDYAEGELAERMDQVRLVGDIVEQWLRIAPDRLTVVFASSVRHSIHIAEQFRGSGVECEHLDGETPIDERARILADLAAGAVRVVSNCMVLTEGWDCPAVSCCVLARPTKSLGLYLQMAGRTLRLAPGKTDCVLIDHAGAVHEHGFVDEPVPWSLDGTSRLQDRVQERKKRERLPTICEGCFTIYRGRRDCPNCGLEAPKTGRGVETVEGDLREMGRNGAVKRRDASTVEMVDWYAQLLWIQREREYKPGWISMQFRERFGKWPPKDFAEFVEPRKPGRTVDGWVRAQLRRYARRKERESDGEGSEVLAG